jgi:hypothetical protein
MKKKVSRPHPVSMPIVLDFPEPKNKREELTHMMIKDMLNHHDHMMRFRMQHRMMIPHTPVRNYRRGLGGQDQSKGWAELNYGDK